MKSKHIFIHSAGMITTETVIYTVYIGTSKEDRTLLEQCRFLQQSTDFFFELYNNTVADFIYNIAKSLYPDCTLPLLRLRQVVLNSREFSKLLRDNVFNCASHESNLSRMLCALDSLFYANNNQLWKRQ